LCARLITPFHAVLKGRCPSTEENFLTAWRADWPAISAHNEDRETESGWLGI